MTKPDVVVLDYGSGNVRSAVRALERVGAQVTLTSRRDRVSEAAGLVVPGVGAFASVMRELAAVDGPEMIDRRLAGGRPVLGICVGMQVMFDSGEEHGQRTEGLGQWPGVVDRLQAPITPHMGWNTIAAAPGSHLFSGLEGERFYFVHSYAARAFPLAEPGVTPFTPPKVTWATHGERFVAAAENGPLCATQFHPEKSGDAGAHLLENWLKTLR